ncbi:MAG: NADH-quinone oxidoreductase subunit K [Proteobacteria bacterium]|nr:NADH-quinone oxidoreductase subunit K [Pseudomonadota bacterium]
MNTLFLYTMSGLALFAIGLHGLIRSSHLLRKILAANLMSSGVFLIMIVGACGTDQVMIDPVPHAMVLTGIVVSVSTTAVALVLVCLVQETTNRALLWQKRKRGQGGRTDA